MADFVTYDYAVNITTEQEIGAESLDYIRNVAVVCVNKDGAATEIEVLTATNKTAVTDKTDAQGVTDLFDGGLNRVALIVLPQSDTTIVSAKDTIAAQENKVLTVLISNEITGTSAEITQNAKLPGGVIGKAFVSADVEEAKVLAATECAFVDNDQALGGMYYAFGKMLSDLTTWTNQQYLVHGKTATTVTVGDVGTAETYFSDRLSFYIDDEALGRNLGFFVAGAKSIVDRYVRAEVSRKIQEVGLQYIQKNKPNNSENTRELLTLEERQVFTTYENAGLLVAGESTLTITESPTDEFMANGTFSMELPSALWRLAIKLQG